jgi:hypothetical protein
LDPIAGFIINSIKNFSYNLFAKVTSCPCCLTEHHTMKTTGKMKMQFQTFLTFVLDREVSGQLHALAALPLIPVYRKLSGLQSWSGHCREKELSCPSWQSKPIPQFPAQRLVTV